MKLSNLILKEELNVAKRKLQKMLQQSDADSFVNKIMSIADENVLDILVDALENPKGYRLEEEKEISN